MKPETKEAIMAMPDAIFCNIVTDNIGIVKWYAETRAKIFGVALIATGTAVGIVMTASQSTHYSDLMLYLPIAMLLGYAFCIISDMQLWSKQWKTTNDTVVIQYYKGVPEEISSARNMEWSTLYHSKFVIAYSAAIFFATLLVAKAFKVLPAWATI